MPRLTELSCVGNGQHYPIVKAELVFGEPGGPGRVKASFTLMTDDVRAIEKIVIARYRANMEDK